MQVYILCKSLWVQYKYNFISYKLAWMLHIKLNKRTCWLRLYMKLYFFRIALYFLRSCNFCHMIEYAFMVPWRTFNHFYWLFGRFFRFLQCFYTKKKNGSHLEKNNCSLKNYIGNQKWLFNGIAVKTLLESLFLRVSNWLNWHVTTHPMFQHSPLSPKHTYKIYFKLISAVIMNLSLLFDHRVACV